MSTLTLLAVAILILLAVHVILDFTIQSQPNTHKLLIKYLTFPNKYSKDEILITVCTFVFIFFSVLPFFI